MRKGAIFGIIAAVSVVVLTSVIYIGMMPEEMPMGKTSVVSTTTILGDFAKEIGGDRIEVTSIVPGGICPAHYDIKPSDVAAVSKANLLFRHGFEPWFDDLLEASGSKEVKVVKIPGLSWGEPSLAIEMIKLINETLCEIDPHNAAYFKESEDNQYKSINETAQRLKEEAKLLNVSDVKVICMKWQEDFVKWLGFDIVATYGPPESLSLGDVNKLIKTGREENVTLVIDNLQAGTDFGKELASELGATQVILTNFPGAIPGTETYTKMIEYNARQIFDAI